ncbi:LysR family transcriptional regulator [Pseudorhodoferax sp.]|uniref:LysR family transcriptional regulator n=1 Tax=Pseudorhodoferax sp. TaxID=1993553 RepID=UPI002DD66A40|nr:LysR substrate-binding domain-containing protein [Pseudorhodoferax sp.]
MGIKLAALQTLLAAVEEGSLRGAARRLGVSQPAVTKAVRELERSVGAPVLQRSTAGVFPTAQGQVLLEHGRRALRELDDAQAQIDQLGGRMIGELGVSAVPLAVMLLIPETMRTFGRDYPDIQLRVREELYVAQLTLLREGEVDVIVGPIPDTLPPGEFEVEELMPIRMAVVVGRGNPLARARSLRQLAGARWVFTSLTGKSGYARQLFELHGMVPPAPAAVVNSTLALLALLTQGDYVGLMPLPIAEHPLAAQFMAVVPIKEGHLPLRLGAIVRRGGLLKPALRHFVAHLHRAAHAPARE